MRKKFHLLTGYNGPAYCGVGNGRRFSQPLGVPLEKVQAEPPLKAEITCDRCAFYAQGYVDGVVEAVAGELGELLAGDGSKKP